MDATRTQSEGLIVPARPPTASLHEEHAAIIIPQEIEVYKVVTYENGVYSSYATWLPSEWRQIYIPGQRVFPKQQQTGFFAFATKELAMRYAGKDSKDSKGKDDFTQVFRATTTQILPYRKRVANSHKSEEYAFLEQLWKNEKVAKGGLVKNFKGTVFCADLMLHERVA